MSDLHVEFEVFFPPVPLPRADVCVVAGDFGIGGIIPALEWLNRHIAPSIDVVFVAGNHDLYGTSFVDEVPRGKHAAERMERVHFLENDSVEIAWVTFIGCTLWTDFAIGGYRELSMFEASSAMSDYRRMTYSKRPFAQFNPLKALRLHQTSKGFLGRTLAGVEGVKVVVTHHAPSERSVPERYNGHRIAPAYASALDDLIHRHCPSAWIHGHIHDPVDYLLGKTRVVSDPRGYPRERGDDFGRMVIDV
jgi:Icc-related predicted phosphoesterase